MAGEQEQIVGEALDDSLEYRVGGQLVQREAPAGLLHEQRKYVELAGRPAAGSDLSYAHARGVK